MELAIRYFSNKLFFNIQSQSIFKQISQTARAEKTSDFHISLSTILYTILADSNKLQLLMTNTTSQKCIATSDINTTNMSYKGLLLISLIKKFYKNTYLFYNTNSKVVLSNYNTKR